MPDLLDRVPGDRPLGMVTAEVARHTQACQAASAARGAGLVACNDALRSCRRPGLLEAPNHGHGRSSVETRMRCFEVLGESGLSRDIHRQFAELRISVDILTRLSAPGVPLTQRAG